MSWSNVVYGLVVVVALVLRASGYVVYFDPHWKLEGWNKNPGFKARIPQSGLDFLRDVGLQVLQKQISSIQIPDIHGSTDVPVIGVVDYDVTQIHITSFGIPTSSLTPNQAVGGLTLKTSGVYLSVHGDWHYKISGFIPISDSGSFDASASSISMQLTIKVGVDSDGRPTVSSATSDCSFFIGNLDVTLHGGASWLYNLFDSQIGDAIKDALNDQICDTVVNAVNTNLEDALKTLEVIAPIADLVEIDYSMVASPTFNGSVSTEHKGEVYPMGSRSECPLPVPQIPPDSDTSRMAFLWITEYLPNSAGYALQKVGFLQYNVTDKTVPEEYRYLLNTSSFAYKFLIPEMSKKFPDMAMEIRVNSTQPPVVSVKPDQITAVLVGDFSPYAVLPNDSQAFLFALNVTIKAKADVGFKKNNVTWKLSTLSTDMSLVRSNVGSFSITLLQAAINSAINAYLIPFLNDYGADGVPLPQLEGFNFVNPVVTKGEAFLKIGTDLTYTP